MKNLVLFCEGVHDVAFLYRLFKAVGFKGYSKPMNQLPSPLNKYYVNQMKNHPYEEMNSSGKLPNLPAMLKKEDLFVQIYAMDGETNHGPIKKIIQDFIDFTSGPDDVSFVVGPEAITCSSFMFFYDADDKGIEYKVNLIKKNFEESIIGINKISHKGIIQENNSLFGCYIFTKDDHFGKLEDITLPLMRLGHENMFDNVKLFLESHDSYIPSNKKKHHDKSIIGIAGQLKEPGLSNYVIIKQADYLTDQKIQNFDKCQEIIEYLISFFDQMKTV